MAAFAALCPDEEAKPMSHAGRPSLNWLVWIFLFGLGFGLFGGFAIGLNVAETFSSLPPEALENAR